MISVFDYHLIECWQCSSKIESVSQMCQWCGAAAPTYLDDLLDEQMSEKARELAKKHSAGRLV